MIKKIITYTILIFLFPTISFSEWDSSSSFDDIFQESINKKFKPIDKKIEDYLNNLNKNKNFCFWKDKKKTFVECVDNIEKIFSISWDYAIWENGYSNACRESLIETIEKQEGKAISTLNSDTIFDDWKEESCTQLYQFKLFIYSDLAYEILKRNKYEILKDEHKLFTQKNRDKHSELLDLMRINLWYIERLRKKWVSKTK